MPELPQLNLRIPAEFHAVFRDLAAQVRKCPDLLVELELLADSLRATGAAINSARPSGFTRLEELEAAVADLAQRVEELGASPEAAGASPVRAKRNGTLRTLQKRAGL